MIDKEPKNTGLDGFKKINYKKNLEIVTVSECILENEMATHSSILPGESHRQRSLVGYRPWGHKESDTTE